MTEKITKEQARLSLIETKSSSDPKSPDRMRAMSRNSDDSYGSALQIVDSQYFVRLLRDRVELDLHYDTYAHAKRRGIQKCSWLSF